MKILVTDGMDKTALAQLKQNGHEVTEQFFPPEELGEDVLGDDLHADALGHAAQGLSNAAEADDAQGLAAQRSP